MTDNREQQYAHATHEDIAELRRWADELEAEWGRRLTEALRSVTDNREAP